MNKSLKVLLISLIFVFSIFCTNCFAVNIEMNLTSDLSNSTIVSDNNELDDLNFSSNSESDNVVDDFDDSLLSSTTSNTSTTTTTSSNTRANVNTSETVHALPESELGLTNVLNILLIAVGFVLILLSIAIFIRLKK